jgi:long-chain acyl-CoA synthetase
LAGELLGRVNQITRALQARGLRPGDGIAAVLPNGAAALEVYLAAHQAGWYFTPINWHFTASEMSYIVRDCRARAFFVHERFAATGTASAEQAGVPAAARFSYGAVPGFTPAAELRAGQPAGPPAGRTAGASMHYTSGTTGRPKGVRRPLPGLDPDDAAELNGALLQLFGVTAGPPNVHLMTSPIYHTAVTVFGGGALHLGHTLVCMDGWDAERALELVQRYRVTNTHMVPTQFKRMLLLPGEIRERYDLSSMRWLIHAAAPCPVGIKQAMLDWWGPCVYEYYAATEGGGTLATPQDWLARPGTVGRPWPVSEVMIVDEAGQRCPPGTPGTVYLKMGLSDFEYSGDPEKTAAGRNGGMFTVGDIGFLDDDGYLFLCDRRADMIISGGVNIYPAEIEAEIIVHPKVADVAVFGIPDEDWGEQVKAVVQPAAGIAPSDALAADILAHLDGRLARMKWPKTIDFSAELPRDPSGKLLRRRLRDPYWAGRGSAGGGPGPRPPRRSGRRGRLARAGGPGQHLDEPRGGRRVRRISVGDREYAAAGPGQRHRLDAGMAGGSQGQPGQGGDPEARRHQRLHGDVIIGGERHVGGEPGQRALAEQLGTAAIAAGDPAVPGVAGKLRLARAAGPGWPGGRPARLSRPARRLCYQVHRLVEQQRATGPVSAGGWPAGVDVLQVMPEHQRDVDGPGAQHTQRIGRIGLGQGQVHAGRLGLQPGRRRRDDGAERGPERGQPDPSLALSDVRGKFGLRGVQPPDDLLGPLGEQPPGVGQPYAAARPLQQPGPGLGLQPGDVVADRGLGVVQRLGRGGDRAVPGHGDQDAEPGHVQHSSTIDCLD